MCVRGELWNLYVTRPWLEPSVRRMWSQSVTARCEGLYYGRLWRFDCLTVSRDTPATRNFLCDRCTPVITIICSLHILFWLMISVWQYSLCLNCCELENAAWCVITAICYGFLNTRWKAVVTSFFSPLSFLKEEKRFGLWDQREVCVCVCVCVCARACVPRSKSVTVIRFSKIWYEQYQSGSTPLLVISNFWQSAVTTHILLFKIHINFLSITTFPRWFLSFRFYQIKF